MSMSTRERLTAAYLGTHSTVAACFCQFCEIHIWVSHSKHSVLQERSSVRWKFKHSQNNSRGPIAELAISPLVWLSKSNCTWKLTFFLHSNANCPGGTAHNFFTNPLVDETSSNVMNCNTCFQRNDQSSSRLSFLCSMNVVSINREFLLLLWVSVPEKSRPLSWIC